MKGNVSKSKCVVIDEKVQESAKYAENAAASAASAENTKEQIENEISAIEIALDKYIAVQSALIGGGGE